MGVHCTKGQCHIISKLVIIPLNELPGISMTRNDTGLKKRKEKKLLMNNASVQEKLTPKEWSSLEYVLNFDC